jgi:hypothetical protein
MPNYSNLSTQVEAIKSEISSSLAASAYSAQDLVYVAKALQALGTVFGLALAQKHLVTLLQILQLLHR